MNEPHNHEGITPSLPPGRQANSFDVRRDADTAAPPDDGQPGEFVVTAAHYQTGRRYSPFIVPAKDEASARAICRRNYLELVSVTRYVEEKGKPKPRVLRFGPPISDKDFEDDYGTRAPAAGEGGGIVGSSYVLSVAGWLLCGPIGGLLGWALGRTMDEHSSK